MAVDFLEERAFHWGTVVYGLCSMSHNASPLVRKAIFVYIFNQNIMIECCMRWQSEGWFVVFWTGGEIQLMEVRKCALSILCRKQLQAGASTVRTKRRRSSAF